MEETMTNNNDKKKKTTVDQMVDAIAKPEDKVKISDKEQKKRYEETRKRLTSRALEYLMFLED